MKIPETTSPLVKLIRTTEGWLVVASNVLLVILGAVGDMSWTKAGTAAAVLAGVTMVARSILKAVTAFSPFVGDPIMPGGTLGPDQPPIDLTQSGEGISSDKVVAAGAPDPS